MKRKLTVFQKANLKLKEDRLNIQPIPKLKHILKLYALFK